MRHARARQDAAADVRIPQEPCLHSQASPDPEVFSSRQVLMIPPDRHRARIAQHQIAERVDDVKCGRPGRERPATASSFAAGGADEPRARKSPPRARRVIGWEHAAHASMPLVAPAAGRTACAGEFIAGAGITISHPYPAAGSTGMACRRQLERASGSGRSQQFTVNGVPGGGISKQNNATGAGTAADQPDSPAAACAF